MRILSLNYTEETIKRDKLGRFTKESSNPWNKGMKGWTNSGSFVSEKMKGKNNPFYGKQHTEESKRKMYLNNPMRNDPEVRKKVSDALRGRKISEEHKEKASKAMKERVANGIHNFWKGGISKYYSELNHSLRNNQWRTWRKKVFERDDYTCQECGARCGNGKAVVLHPHHTIAVVDCIRQGNINLIYDIDNGKTVCIECHRIIHGKNRR